MVPDELLETLTEEEEAELLDEVEPLVAPDELAERRARKRGGQAPRPGPTPPDVTETLARLRGHVRPKRIAAFDIETVEWTWPYAAAFYERSLKEPLIWTSRRTMPRKWPHKKRGPDCIDQFLEHFLQPQYIGVTCYAHNGGNFDFIPVFERMFCESVFPRRGYRVKLFSIQSCLYKLEIEHPDHDGKWILLDSTRTFPMTLERLGESFVGHGKVDLAAALGVPQYRLYRHLALMRNDALMRKYLRRDVLLLYKGVRTFQRLINAQGGNLKATIGATAMDTFRRSFMRGKTIYTNRHFSDCPDLKPGVEHITCQGCGHAFIRGAYKGGRTEIETTFGGHIDGSGKGKRARFKVAPELVKAHPWLEWTMYYYDVNSMYPDCMRAPMPTGIATVLGKGRPEDILNQARSMVGIIDCTVEIPKGCYLPPLPVLCKVGKTTRIPLGPYEHKSGAKLIFPTGTFRGVWDTAELQLLPQVGGRIVEVHKQAWFTTSPVFNEFVDHFYKYRNKDDPSWTPGMDQIAKLILNNLYGKFGQGELNEELFLDPPEEMIGKLDLYSTIRLGIFYRYAPHKPEHVVPALAVHITSLARARLWRIMTSILDLGGRVYYCDTDSVVCAFPPGQAPWASETHLGGLKMEHKLRGAQFVLPKLYLIDCADDCPCGWKKKGEARQKVKAKGLSPGLGRKLSAAAWFRLTDMTEDPVIRQWKRRHIAKWRTSIDLFAKNQLKFFQVLKTTKAIQTSYDKRAVLNDGPTTEPWHLSTTAPVMVPQGAPPLEASLPF